MRRGGYNALENPGEDGALPELKVRKVKQSGMTQSSQVRDTIVMIKDNVYQNCCINAQ